MNPLSAHAWGRTPGKRVGLLACLLFVATVAYGQWQRVSVPTTSSLRGLSAVNENVVWASGTEGTVIKTIDGGKSWNVMAVSGAEKLDFRGIRAFGENNAVIISSGPAEKGQARIYRTVDGGKNWTMVFEEHRPGIFFDAVAFWDRDSGIVLSDPVEGKFALFTTADGGVTWGQVSSSGMPAALPNEGAFAASNSCLAVKGPQHVWFATGGASIARVFRSVDRGKTWSVSNTPIHPSNASSGIFSLKFQDFRYGFGVGGDYAHPNSSTSLNYVFTSDGGKNWEEGATNALTGVYLSSAASFWSPGKDSDVVVGTGGLWIAEGGGKWVKESDSDLNSVAATGGQSPTIWAVGMNGLVLRNLVRYVRGRRR